MEIEREIYDKVYRYFLQTVGESRAPATSIGNHRPIPSTSRFLWKPWSGPILGLCSKKITSIQMTKNIYIPGMKNTFSQAHGRNFILIFLDVDLTPQESLAAKSPSSASKITPYERGLIYGLAPWLICWKRIILIFICMALNHGKNCPGKYAFEHPIFMPDKVLAYLGDSQDTELRILARSILPI